MKTNAKINIFFMLLIAAVLAHGCEQDEYLPVNDDIPASFDNGVFIINEGNFGGGNGSVSFLDPDKSRMYNRVFREINKIPLGDIPQSMYISDGLGYIVVNNSARIEVVNMLDFSSVNTISGFTSPRNFLQVSDSTAYVSDLFGTSISIVNTDINQVTGSIETGMSTEQMLKINNEIFVANWSGGDKILIIDPLLNEVKDSIDVILEPNSMVVDKNNKLWVLCSGGYTNEEIPAFLYIDPVSREKEKTLKFDVLESNPSDLCVNGSGDTLYFLYSGSSADKQGIYQMSVTASEIPPEPIIQTDKGYYSIGVDPVSGIVYAADAIDFQQKGKVFRYLQDGALKDSFVVDIIPGSFVFNR